MGEENVTIDQPAYCCIDVARAGEDGRECFDGDWDVKQCGSAYIAK